MAKMSGEGNQIPGHSWASFLKDNTPSSSENVRTEKRRKSGDMHTKLTLGDKPLLGDMPKVEEFSTVCCRLCKWPVKTQSVKEHMALRHPDYSAARLREEAERFQVKIMINSIPESLFAAVPSYKSHMLSPVHVTSPVAPCVPDVVDEDTAAVVDLLGSLAPVPAAPTPTPTPPPPPAMPAAFTVPPAFVAPPAMPPEFVAPTAMPAFVAPSAMPPEFVAPTAMPAFVAPTAMPAAFVAPPAMPSAFAVPPAMPAAFAAPPAMPLAVKEEPLDVKLELLDGVEVVSSEEQMGAVLSLKTEVPGAFVDILNEFESDAGAADDETETAAAVAALTAITAITASPLAAAPLEPEPPACVFSPPPPPPPAPVAAPPPLAVSPRVPSKAEFKSVPSSPSRPLTDTADGSSISEHFAKMRAGGNSGSLCSKKSRLGTQPRQYDPRKHCGVWITERDKNCTRVLDCRQHNLEQKSKVPRPLPFKDLLARFKAGKSRERDTVKPMSMRYDPKFVPPEGHPAATGAAAAAAVSPSRSGGMVTYHNITNSPVFRRDRSSSADDDGMPPPSSVPPRSAGAAPCPPPPPPPPPPEICVPRISSYPQPLAVGGAARLSSRGGCLGLVDRTSQLSAAFRSMFQPARRGQQSLLKINQTRVAPTAAAASAAAAAAAAAAASAVASATVTATANGQLTPSKRPPESPLGAAPAVKKQRPAAAAGAAPVAARPPAAAAAAAAASSPLTLQLQQTGTTAAVNAVLAAAAAAAGAGGGGGSSSAARLQHQQQHQQQQHALLNLQQGGRNVTLGQVGGLQTQQVNIQLPKGGLPSNIRLTLPSSALSHLQGISNDAKMIAINSNKVPINRMGPAGAGAVSLGQRVARIGAPSALPVHHLSQQVLGQIQIPRLPGSAGGLTFKVQQQGGLVMRPEQS